MPDGEKEIQPTGANYLISSGGFRRIGEWRLAGDEGFELTDPAPKEPGVYAFVVDDVVCYVGVTLTTLHTRMPWRFAVATTLPLVAASSTTARFSFQFQCLRRTYVSSPNAVLQHHCWHQCQISAAAGWTATQVRTRRPSPEGYR